MGSLSTSPPRFMRIGSRCQLRIAHAADLVHVLTLDPALWAVTSAPLSAFHCDRAFLDFLDTDRSGRIDSDEVKAAVKWLLAQLCDASGVSAGAESLDFAAFAPDAPLRATLIAAARHVLQVLGLNEAETIELATIRRFQSVMRNQPLNGDGVIVPDAASDAALRAYLTDALDCTGGTPDVSGRQGVDRVGLAAFAAAVGARLEWLRRGREGPDGALPASIFPFGDQTAQAYQRFCALAPRVERFFALCKALRFSPAARLLGRDPAGGGSTDFAETLWQVGDADLEAQLAALPLAEPRVDGCLQLNANAINPLDWPSVDGLRRMALLSDSGEPATTLTLPQWRGLRQRLDPYRAYLEAGRAGDSVQRLSEETLQRYADESLFEQARRLIEADHAVGERLNGVAELERLLCLQANLVRFTNNFVNLSELYTVTQTALFEMGAAVIDGRWFALALPVEDLGAHASQAKFSGLFSLYAEISRVGSEKRHVVLPATAYTRGNLGVGKRGVFFDRVGREHDLRVVQVVDNPISFAEALFAPFIRIWDFLVGKIESIAAANERQLQQNVDGMTPTAAPGSTAVARPALFGGPAGAVLGISMSMAAMGSALAFMTRMMGSLRMLLVGLGVAVALLVLPLTLIAVTKLMRQDLGGLLEASGWAVNARLRLTLAQRRQFTRRAPYPKGAEGLPATARIGFWLALGLTFLFWLIRRFVG